MSKVCLLFYIPSHVLNFSLCIMAAFGCGQVGFLTELEVFANLILIIFSPADFFKLFSPGKSFFLLQLACGSLFGYNSQNLH